jgi:hypothetical protein
VEDRYQIYVLAINSISREREIMINFYDREMMMEVSLVKEKDHPNED